MMKNLITKFRETENLSVENEMLFLKTLKKVEVESKTILQEAGKVANKLYFVEKGLVRTYNYKDGKDITYWISTENSFIGAVSSYFMREPSIKVVETLEDCILWEFDYHKLESVFNKNKELGNLARFFSNYGISLVFKRLDDLHFYSAKERYQILLKSQPTILQRAPLSMVASFLGMSQETLSRIRAQK